MSRVEKNMAILKKLKAGKLRPDEIGEYSGWGGLRNTVAKETDQLLRLASSDEVKSMLISTGSGYFTPAPIVEAIYTGLDRLGASYERVLEPAAGVGAFIAGARRRGAEVVAVELDSITSRLLQHRYESVGVIEGGFEYVTRDMFSPFDLVIGNPPYGSQVMADQQDKRLDGLVIHHYFLAKSFQFLAEGGMLAMVVPAYCLDNVKKHARDIMAELGAKLVAAFRLPDDCFDHAKVTVDVVFFEKELNADHRKLPWQKTVYQPVNGYRLPINEGSVINKVFSPNCAMLILSNSYRRFDHESSI